MTSFLIFILILGITPGPNNTLALSEGRTKGFLKSQSFVVACIIGNALLAIIAGFAVVIFQRFPILMFFIKFAGSIYLLYIAWHIFRSDNQISESGGLEHPIRSGISLQFINPKAYVGIVTGLSVMARNTPIPIKVLIILIIIYACLSLWVGLGQSLRKIFETHARIINTILALLLVFSTIDLWF